MHSGESANARRGWGWPALIAVLIWLALLAITLVPEWRVAAAAELSWMLAPLYHDWQVLRLGWAAAADGVDPLALASHPFNYPRAALAPAWVGAQNVPLFIAGLLLAAAVLGALLVLLRPSSLGQAILAAVLIASPPVLLLLERGNLDAVVLVLVVAGLGGLAPGRTRGLHLAGVAALVVAALVKWYPAAVLLGLAGVWRDTRRYLVLGALAVVTGWIALNGEEVALVMQKTTRGLVPAYGRMLLGSRYYVEAIRPTVDAATGDAWLRGAMQVSLVCCVIGYLAAACVGWRSWRHFGALLRDEREVGCFLAGASIYAGTFLLGSNWSYRLVFLLLTIPLLWRMWSEADTRTWGGLGLATVGVVVMSPFVLPLPVFLLQQGVAWVLAFYLVAVVVALAFGMGKRDGWPHALGRDGIVPETHENSGS